MTGRALLLPGRLYTVDMPLLAVARERLEQRGWETRPVSWAAPVPVPGEGAWIGARAAEAVAGDPGPWLFAAKSLGTRVVQSDLRADAYVLLTPLLADPAHAAAVTRLVDEGLPVLLVGGTADEAWSSEAAAATGAEVFEVPGADHAMAGSHLEVGAAVDAFLATLPVSRGR